MIVEHVGVDVDVKLLILGHTSRDMPAAHLMMDDDGRRTLWWTLGRTLYGVVPFKMFSLASPNSCVVDF